jgi:hypothetical protein
MSWKNAQLIGPFGVALFVVHRGRPRRDHPARRRHRIRVFAESAGEGTTRSKARQEGARTTSSCTCVLRKTTCSRATSRIIPQVFGSSRDLVKKRTGRGEQATCNDDADEQVNQALALWARRKH